MMDRVPTTACCLCKACLNICPAGAIVFDREEHTFLYSRINQTKCVHCGGCEKVCPSLHPERRKPGSPRRVYAAKNRNTQERLRSSSGGIFIALAEKMIGNQGAVCGVVFQEGFQARHIVTRDVYTVQKMQGSKYVQSDLGLSFRQIEKLLAAGTPVLFCGCPCQVAGLKSYLGGDHPSLYLVDLICHGVLSQGLLDSYLQYLENKYRAKITDFQFRSKALGWHNSAVSVSFANGKRLLEPMTVNAYMKTYFAGITQKEACFSCPYKGFQSGADITLGDLWGAETLLPQWDDNRGLSAVLIHSEKGAKLFDSLQTIEAREFPLESVIQYNRNLLEPTHRGGDRQRFFAYAAKNGYEKCWKDLMQETPLEKCRRELTFLLRCALYKIQGRKKPLY